MKKILHPATTRGAANYGWLQAKYSFSFANFFDPNRIQFGKLRVLNDDIIAPGMGFGKHPHNNMEIITIPQEGSVKHKDSMGNEGIVSAGEIQVMSAGTGIEHSEMNAKPDSPLKLFQVWIFPETENVTPRYDQKSIASLLKPNELTTIVKPKSEATEDELWVHQQAFFNLGEFETDKKFQYTIQSPGHGAYFLVIEGKVTIENDTIENRDAIGVWDTNSIEVSVTKGTRLLVIEVPMN